MSVKRALFFAVGLCCLISVTEPKAQEQTTKGVVVQMSYFAKPGYEKEVLSIRLSASDVLERNGVTRGRLMTRGESARETKNPDSPDVVWEGEFPDAASLKRYQEIADKHPDFIAARQECKL